MNTIIVVAIVSFILGGIIFRIITKYQMVQELEEVRRKESNQRMWQNLLIKGGDDE